MTQLSLLTVPADAWMVALVETSLRISVVLLAAGGIAMVLRRSSANLRHLVWALALAGALLVPVGASYLPAVNLPVRLPWLALGGVAAADRAQRVWEISSAMSAGVTLGDTEDAEGLPVRPAGVVTPPNASAASGRALPSVAGAASPGSGVPQPDSRRTAVVPSWSQLLAGGVDRRCRGPAPQNRSRYGGDTATGPSRRAATGQRVAETRRRAGPSDRVDPTGAGAEQHPDGGTDDLGLAPPGRAGARDGRRLVGRPEAGGVAARVEPREAARLRVAARGAGRLCRLLVQPACLAWRPCVAD